MRFSRAQHSICSECPLRDRNRVWGEGPLKPKLVLIGEAPGDTEDRKGRPFVGAAGEWFDRGLLRAGLRRENIWVTNVLSCRPPNNKIDHEDALEAIRCCEAGLLAELSDLRKRGVKVRVLLGNTPSEVVLGERGINKIRGSVYTDGKNVTIPTYHPAWLMRDQRMWDVWIADLVKAKEIAEEGWVPPEEHFNIRPTLNQLKKWYKHLKPDTLIGVDIETTSLYPSKGDIIVVGLADSGESAISFPFLSKGKRQYWHPTERVGAEKILRNVLRRNPTVFQNAMFDVKWLEEFGFPIGNLAHDVMLAHHAIHPELPHDLSFIVSIYGKTPYWKGEVLERESRMLDMEDEQLRTYNLRDAVVLHQVLPGLLDDLRDDETASVYKDVSLKLIRPILAMEKKGMLIDKKRLAAWKRSLQKTHREQDKQLKEKLHPAFNLDSDDDVRLLLYGWTAPKFAKAEEELKKKKRTDTAVYTKLKALTEIAATTRQLLLPKGVRISSTKGGKMSVDEDTLLTISRAVRKRLLLIKEFTRKGAAICAEEKALKETASWLKLFLAYNKTGKLLSTYTDYQIGIGGRIYPSFIIHGTATGRLASRNPNAQNIPEGARHIFVAPEGYSLISADYINLELIILAYVSNDGVLKDIFKRGGNIHDENTKILFKISEKHPKWKEWRRAAKIYIFGRNYGGGIEGIYQRVLLEAPDADLSFSQFRAADEAYRKMHPAYDLWRDTVLDRVKGTRELTSCFGRKRIFLGSTYEIEKEGLNFLIQSPAADIINHALISLHAALVKGEYKAKVICQVHDQLILECPRSEEKRVIALLRKHMEWEATIGESKVRFPIEISKGPSWGELKPVSLR